MTVQNKMIDYTVIGASTGSATWAFVSEYIGLFAQLLGIAVAILTVYVLIQRIRINRRELEKRD